MTPPVPWVPSSPRVLAIRPAGRRSLPVDLNGDGRDRDVLLPRGRSLRLLPDEHERLPGCQLASGTAIGGWSTITPVDLDDDGRDEMFFYREDGLYAYYR